MKAYIFLLMALWAIFTASCKGASQEKSQPEIPKVNGKIITDPAVQDSLFLNLSKLTYGTVDFEKAHDSLAFLLLPVKATCPACRKKTIDSIAKYAKSLDSFHLVIITGNGSKSIGGYFKEEGKELPFEKGIFYDTLDIAFNANMTSTNPNVYYSYNKKVYRKVSVLPQTIKQDLREFFGKMNF